VTGLLSLLLVSAGLGCFAVAMPQHWRQWRGNVPRSPAMVRALRLVGALAQLGALLLCLTNAHPSIGALVWVMQLALGAVLVALVFASRTSPDRG
jgi:hypothetical protein